jgi:hypothetical protein
MKKFDPWQGLLAIVSGRGEKYDLPRIPAWLTIWHPKSGLVRILERKLVQARRV